MEDLFNDIVVKELTDRNFIHFINKIGDFDIKNGPWIAGGSVRKAYYGEDWTKQDVDIFFKDENQLSLFKHNLAKLAKNKIDIEILDKTFQISNFDDENSKVSIWYDNVYNVLMHQSTPLKKPILSNDDIVVHVHFKSDNAITFEITTNDINHEKKALKLQVINTRMSESFVKLINDFDLTACQFVTDGKFIYTKSNALLDCENKKIKIANSLSSIHHVKPVRIAKYMAYGFTLEDDQMKEFINRLTLNGALGESNDY